MSTEASAATGPLAGIRVLDFTALLQGPMATQILADLGADVVKLERQGGEWMRHWGVFMGRTHGETDAFLGLNRNKRSVEVDLRDEETRERILKLVGKADVVVENFRPGVMDRAGLGYETLCERNPAIIYAASSGYGQSGPYVDRPGQDYLVQALTGAMWLVGRREDPPFVMPVPVADMFTGMHLVIGILAALQHRNRTGEGQRIDVDLLSCMMAAQLQEITVFLNHGEPFERAKRNVGHPGLTAPCGVYATSDGWLMLAMFPCPRLGEILGVDWLAEFDTNEKMYAARDIVHERLSEHFAADTTDHWIELLSSNDVWCAPVRSYSALEDDPQIRHRNMIWDLTYSDTGRPYRTVGSPFTFSATPVNVRSGAPRSGQHNKEFESGKIWED
jgi:crotonobetainyl-CoA:carnitine CoA-transferase CaiB-like acyl-CoA transferase